MKINLQMVDIHLWIVYIANLPNDVLKRNFMYQKM